MLPKLNFTLIVSLTCLLAVSTLSAGEKLDPPTGEEIVSPDASLEHLFTRSANIEGGLTEGPAVAPDGSIYFSDIPFGTDKGMILRFDPKTKKTTLFSNDSHKSNGLIFDAQGNLLACEGSNFGGQAVVRWNLETAKRTILIDRFKGKRFNAPNDLCLDSKGRIYFTDPRYLGDEPRELEHRAVYRINTDGSVIEITHEVSKPNGIALSPNENFLYLADHDNGTDKIDPTKPAPKHGPMKIYRFRLDENGLVTGKRKTIVDFGEEAGCDGMTVDENGSVYLTVRSLKRPGVMVVNSNGKEIAFIPTGPKNQKTDPDHPAVGMPSNVEFGIGKESNVLYVTVDKSLYRIPLKAKGYHRQYR
ncbi:MAG: SMP-30/gluconolactonase/LRE family protein [Planctomycetes bacterium]|nr:SMP-30/gluconolactonase/LRE family protein [Planctomycetota bacterium]